MVRRSASYGISHRRLLWRVARIELRRGMQSRCWGMSWVLLYPFVVRGIYAVLYVFTFQVRPQQMTPAEYVVYMFSGLVLCMMTSESLSSGVIAVVANKSVLNNTVFPIGHSRRMRRCRSVWTAHIRFQKIIREMYSNYYSQQYGLPVVKARFQNVYGPCEILGAGQWRGTPAMVRRKVTPTFIHRACKHMPLTVEN